MKNKALIILIAAGSVGCGNDRYQIIAAQNGGFCHAYRLDTRTGEMLCVSDNMTFQVAPSPEPEKK